MSDGPAIQLIANLVVAEGDRVLLARYDPGTELDATDADTRWWLPARELEPYEHPDGAARQALAEIGGLEVDRIDLVRVQSFRGRRGWHISFDYRVAAGGQPADGRIPAAWFRRDGLPRTMHGRWERETIEAVLEASP